MSPRLPIVAQPGLATVTTVRRETGHPAIRKRKKFSASRDESRRTETRHTSHTVFCGYTHDVLESESLRKPDIAWCERNCHGLWRLIHGPYVPGYGYEVRFGFTEKADADRFIAYRQTRRERQEGHGT